MKISPIKFIACSLFFIGCTDTTKQTQINSERNLDTSRQQNEFISVDWVDSSQVQLAKQNNLSYASDGFVSDSVLAISYTGFEGEHFFYPLNEKGQWINQIHDVKKIQPEQEKLVAAVLGDYTSFRKPLIIPCFEPRFALVYFRDGNVIAQTAICFGCARLMSTIKFADPKKEGLINEEARQKLRKLCEQLRFSDCRN